jgi:glutamate dehydrogenase
MSTSYRLGASPRLCFEKYIDVSADLLSLCRKPTSALMGQSVLDLLIPGQSPGIKERLVDLYNKPEILFFGPDGTNVLFGCTVRMFTYIFSPEGTADMMDWAARKSHMLT